MLSGRVECMSFPTADVVDGNMRMLQAWGIEAKIREQRPDLADRVIVDEARPLVRLVLPDARSVGCAPVRLGNVVNWTVMAPGSDFDTHMAHRFDIHTKVELADMMITAYDEYTATTAS